MKLSNTWYHACAQCDAVCSLEDHTFSTETLTVYPSIVCPNCGAHYFVSKGEVKGL